MSKVFVTDMDDVLVDLLSEWTKFLNAKHGLNVSPEEIVDWEMSKAYPTLCPQQIFAPLGDANLWYNVKPKKGAVNGLKALKDKGYQVYVATASHYNTLKHKLELALFRYFNFLHYSDIVVCYNKQLIECDYIVDDKIDNLIGHKGVTFLMDAPYNRNVDASLYDFRVHDFQEIIQIIEELEVLENE